MSDNKTVTFLYPCRSIGGAQNLIIRLSKQLAQKNKVSINIVDFEEGFIWKALRGIENVSLIAFGEKSKIDLPDNTTLVIYPSYFDKIDRIFNLQTRANLLVWFIQPYLLISLPSIKLGLKAIIPARIRKVKRLLDSLNAENALLFMDQENFEVNKDYFNLNFSPQYLPIPTVAKNVVFEKKKRGVVNIAWLGRISGEKVNSIKHLLFEVDRFNKSNKEKVRFHIIGGGDAMNELKPVLKGQPADTVIFTGVLMDEELERYLLTEIDCMFAMGTSALDSAAYQIPTILIDFSSYAFGKLKYTYKYKWLFETKGFTLGQDVNYYLSENQLTFNDVISIISSDQQNQIGIQCYNYVMQNHNIERIADLLIEQSEKSVFGVKNAPDYSIEYTFLVKHAKKLLKKIER